MRSKMVDKIRRFTMIISVALAFGGYYRSGERASGSKVKTVVFIIGLLLVASCSKYEEGPLVSLRSKKARLEGNWDLELLTDLSGTSDYPLTITTNDSIACTSGAGYVQYDESYLTRVVWQFKKDGQCILFTHREGQILNSASTVDLCVSQYYATNDEQTSCTWVFEENKEYINVLPDDPSYDPIKLKIVQLKNGEMKLRDESVWANYKFKKQ